MDLPQNETVRLIQGIQRVMHTPRIVEGKTSSSGKTILVERENQSNHRLDTEAILRGESQFRGAKKYKLYTPERMQSSQRGNKAPGPQAGVNRISEENELPGATHELRD